MINCVLTWTFKKLVKKTKPSRSIQFASTATCPKLRKKPKSSKNCQPFTKTISTALSSKSSMKATRRTSSCPSRTSCMAMSWKTWAKAVKIFRSIRWKRLFHPTIRRLLSSKNQAAKRSLNLTWLGFRNLNLQTARHSPRAIAIKNP